MFTIIRKLAWAPIPQRITYSCFRMSQADLTEEAINAELELQIENEIEIGDQDMDELQEPPEVDAEGGQEAIFDEVRKALDLLSSSSDPAKSMAYIKDEYEKMNKLFVESRRNESQLVKKCKEMAIELSSSSRKLQTALKLSQTDRANIANLQKENKKAWKHVEINAEKEERNKELIANLKSEIEVLRSGKGGDTTSLSSAAMNRQKLVELQMEQEEEIRKINKEKASLEASYQKDQETIKALQDDLQSSQEKISLNLQEKRAMEEELQILKDFMASKKVETVSFTQLKDKLEQSLKSAMDASEKKDDELKLKSLEMKALKENLARIEKQSQNEKIRSEKFEKENDAFTSKINKIQQDYEDKLSENHKIHNINLELKRTIEIRDDEMNTIKDGLKQVTRLKDGALKKYKQLDEARMNVEIERDTLRSTNAHLAHDIELLKKEIENQAKQLEMVVRERDISQKNFVKSTTATQKQFNVLKLSEQSQRNLEQEIQAYKDEAQKMRKLIYTLEKDRDNRFNEASKLAQLLASQEEDIKMKDMMIFDNKKKISEFEKKLKEQQALYENVRADRNVYSKNLLESQDEISEMKRKVKIMMHQVEQLKEEIAAKEAGIFW
jgi:chromosome segregation ATPase